MRALIIIAVIVGILFLAGVWLKTWYGKITFKVTPRWVDLSTLDMQSLLGLGETSAKLLLNLEIKNDNSFAIPCRNLKAWLYYDKTIIAETSSDLATQNFRIPAHGIHNVTDNVNVHVNSASIKLLKEAALKKNSKVEYTVKFTVFGIRISYSDYFPFKA